MEKKQKQFVWNGLRISFWIMIALWGLFTITNYPTENLDILSWVWVISAIATFVLSIIHLVKYKQKTFAITSLVISSIWVFIFIIGMIIGIMGAL
jgi:hypothetical protein